MTTTWSWSRHRTFQHCRRRYWYEVYGARGGWRAPVGDRRRELYALKRLVGRGQWVGLLVHDLAEQVLRARRDGREPDPGALIDDLARQVRRTIDDARRGLPRLDPRRYVDFQELAYEGDPGDGSWQELVEDAVGTGRSLLAHPAMSRLLEVPQRIVGVEEAWRGRIAGELVIAIPDVVVGDGRGGHVIIDWKTGRDHDPVEVDAQLGVYALAIHGAVVGLHASVRDGTYRSVPLGEPARRDARRRIAASASEIARVTGDDAAEERFDRLPVGDPACGRCRFRRACDR